ncbi:MAG: hypothetical protein IJM53_01410 [Lachnospiraceae bacterium]|nr:hypothetical protein [Lachnospiraceae bacterium]
MLKKSSLSLIINGFQKSKIQSEAEVRSKFVVPLIEWLGFPSEYRAEEFPVYGYNGSKPLSSKHADFLMFNSDDFATHRQHTEIDCNWVQEHSLLVVEVKKPGNIIKPLEQAQFYSAWTKSVAYIETDGIRLIGRFYNDVSKDYEVLDLDISDIQTADKILNFSFDNLSNIKSNFNDFPEEMILPEEDFANLKIPKYVYSGFSDALGKNAEHLDDMQTVATFLNATNHLLQSQLRYNIPEYMFDIPRGFYRAKIYSDEMMLPSVVGNVTYYNWNVLDKYEFQSDYFICNIITVENQVAYIAYGFSVQDITVDNRIEGFNTIKKCISARNIRLSIEDSKSTLITIPIYQVPDKNKVEESYNYWLEEMNKLKEIENYYGIKFKLFSISKDETAKTFFCVDTVYNGICQQQNYIFNSPGNLSDEDIEIEEPTVFEKDKDLNIENQEIYGIVFQAYKSTFLPCTLEYSRYKEEDIVPVPCSIEFKLLLDN